MSDITATEGFTYYDGSDSSVVVVGGFTYTDDTTITVDDGFTYVPGVQFFTFLIEG